MDKATSRRCGRQPKVIFTLLTEQLSSRGRNHQKAFHRLIDATWLVLWLVMPTGFTGQLVAFGLFRLFDAVKVGPMAWADRTFKGFGPRGGFGILLDDFAAALCTLLVIALWRF